MNAETRRLVLRLVRVQYAYVQAAERWDEAAHRDAGFDGGEFSGPASARALEREGDALAQRIGFNTLASALLVAEALGCLVRDDLAHEYRPDHNGECLVCDEPFEEHAAHYRGGAQ